MKLVLNYFLSKEYDYEESIFDITLRKKDYWSLGFKINNDLEKELELLSKDIEERQACLSYNN